MSLLKGQSASVSTMLGDLFLSFVWDLLSEAGVSCRLGLVARAGSSPAIWSMSCGCPVNTHSLSLTVLCMLRPQNSLTCAFPQLWPDIVKAFLTSAEQRATLGHGAIIRKKKTQAVRQRVGVLGETPLLICILTGDSVGVLRLSCTLVPYLSGGLVVLPLIQRGFEKKKKIGWEESRC